MAFNTGSIPSTPAAPITTYKQNGLHHSNFSKNLCKHFNFRSSYSDNQHHSYIIHIRAMSVQPKQESSRYMNMMRKEIKKEVDIGEQGDGKEVNRPNWVERLMEITRCWRNRSPKGSIESDMMCGKNMNDGCDYDEDEGVCVAGYEEEEIEDGQVTFDCDSFSKFLVQVSWYDTIIYSQLALLSNMAYVIPQIKSIDLRRYYGLQFITSLDKKAEAAKLKDKLEKDSTRIPKAASVTSQSGSEQGVTHEPRRQIPPFVAFEIAATYVLSQAKNILSLCPKSQKERDNEDSNGREDPQRDEAERIPRDYKAEAAAHFVPSTMTAVGAGGEGERQKAAKDLQSLQSSPCEWFVCDDSRTYTRCFVIQGSHSLASWQASIFIEPAKFEGKDVLVHRGVYEAAKGIYEHFMPEIMDHLKKYGDRAKFQFTGHSLGGSISLLIHLMLLTRKVVSPSTIRPVVTFGSPFVFCGGWKMLKELGMDENHIHCIMMHRDIVPRLFSCNYPNHVAIVLKSLNGSFRSHPCLLKNKLLYSPLGKILILQPDEETSPPHPLLPSGNALYALENSRCEPSSSVLMEFLNQPHPLETLSDLTAYNSEGTIWRDHNVSNYLKAVNGVLRNHSKATQRTRRQRINQL